MSRISYKEFTLPFFESPSFKLNSLMREVPANALFLGSVESSMGNWCEWKVEDHFYLIPWIKAPFTWGLFRITWEDNWSRYEWNSVARITGITDPKLASRRLLRGAFRMWNVDLRKKDFEPYKTLLEECGA
jgi:hypothetical protein